MTAGAGSGETWLSQNAELTLLYGCLIEAYVYMKGDPTFPQCGFSSTVVQILKHIGVEFKSHDVLQDENLREGIKSFSNWPTIPQLYVNNEFVGGCDIIREMFESGELKEYFTVRNQTLMFRLFLRSKSSGTCRNG